MTAKKLGALGSLAWLYVRAVRPVRHRDKPGYARSIASDNGLMFARACAVSAASEGKSAREYPPVATGCCDDAIALRAVQTYQLMPHVVVVVVAAQTEINQRTHLLSLWREQAIRYHK